MALFNLSVLLLLITSLWKPSVQNSCAFFHFPTLQTNTIEETENTTLQLPFKLINKRCTPTAFKNITVIIAREDSFLRPICSIDITNGLCQEFIHTSNCKCLDGAYSYEFSRPLSRSDSATWVWQTDTGIAEKKDFRFNVIYPAEVRSLAAYDENGTLLKEAVSEYSRVSIVCHLQQGNPPTMPYLLTSSTSIRKACEVPAPQPGLNDIECNSPPVTCEDSGEISCQAPGSSVKKSITLLVKCAPTFPRGETKKVFNVMEGDSLDLMFNVMSYTTRIEKCRMTLIRGLHAETKSKNCMKSSLLKGVSPHLTLTISVDSVMSEDAGEWRLILGNKEGSRHIDFFIIVHNGTEEDGIPKVINHDILNFLGIGISTTTANPTYDNNHTAGLIVGVPISAVVVVILVVVIVVAILRTKDMCWRAQAAQRHRPVRHEERPASLELERRRQDVGSEHIYCDISENVDAIQAGLRNSEGGADRMQEGADCMHPMMMPQEQSVYHQPSHYALLNPTYETFRSAYSRLVNFGQRVSRRLSRHRPEEAFEPDFE